MSDSGRVLSECHHGHRHGWCVECLRAERDAHKEAVANLLRAVKLMRGWLENDGGWSDALEEDGIDAAIAALDEK